MMLDWLVICLIRPSFSLSLVLETRELAVMGRQLYARFKMFYAIAKGDKTRPCRILAWPGTGMPS